MKSLVALFLFVAVAAAIPVNEQIVSVSQDTLGNYKLKYVIEGISRVEHGDANGNINGGYSYIDPHGVLRKIEFTAGINGFQAIGTDIPTQVADTPEVAVAKSHHLELLRAAELKSAEIPLVKTEVIGAPAPAIVAPAPIAPVVQLGSIPETPEVLAARAEHFSAHEAARKLLIH
ncbi:hypothetical protein RN001_002552 [Aquatica leii]|uniref:Cuticle protein n=1 Tax=Aquatica leii TaxID=1421715 RepID=A0AAN7PPZ7_9COLE|nr:hypothetical protein RN001_002552 [Aquatica leii]